MALPTLGVKDKDDVAQTINTLASGRGAAADSASVVLSTEDKASLDGITQTADAVAGATDTGVSILGVRDDALSTITPIEGDYAPVRVDANGALWTHDDALDAALSGNELQVDIVAALPAGTNAIGKLAANSGVDIGDVDVLSVIPGTAATNLGKAIDTAAGATDTGVAPVGIRDDALSTITPIEGDYAPVRVGSTGALWVQMPDANGNAVDPVAQVAHDAADSGDPIKMGHKAIAGLSTATLVAADDRTDSYAGVDGAQFVRPNCGLEDIVKGHQAITDGASTSVIAAQGAGIKVYITDVIISNSSATAAEVTLRDGTAGATLATLPAPADAGVVKSFTTPLPFSANTAVAADPDATLSTINVTLIGFKSKI